MGLYSDNILADNPASYYRFDEVTAGSAYGDSTSQARNIVSGHSASEVGPGRAAWSAASRISATGVPLPYTQTSISEYTVETFFRATEPGKYVMVDMDSSTADPEMHIEVSQSSGSYVLKFGFGVGAWDIDLDDTHQHAFVYTDECDELFDGDWHHLVFVLAGTPGALWSADHLSILIDGVHRENIATRSDSTVPANTYPFNFGGPLYVTGPVTGANDHTAFFDELAVYTHVLSDAQVREHFNNAASINTVFEGVIVPDFVTFTNGILNTAYEVDAPLGLTYPIPGISIASTSSVSAVVATSDTLAARDVLVQGGNPIPVDLSEASVEPGEPNQAGYTKTIWFELPLNPDNVTQERITLSSPTSTGRVSVYKQPSLDQFDNYEDLDEDETETAFADDAEPDMSQFILMQTASTDQVLTLDQEYGSSYFLQVGLKSGTGDDFTLSWGDATPGVGGTFDGAAEVSGAWGYRFVNTTNAFLEPNEPNSTGVTETRSIWLHWLSPAAPLPTVFSIQNIVDTIFSAEVYTGTEIDALSQVTSGLSPMGSELVELSFTPEPSTYYYIRVAATADNLNYIFSWAGPQDEYVSHEPVQHLKVTVHAGVGGGSWGGKQYAANEMITELPNRMGAQFQESLNVPGSGSVTLLQNDKTMRAFNPTDWPFDTHDHWNTTLDTFSNDPFQLVQFGNFIKFWMNDKCVHAFIIKNREVNVVGAGEEADRTITVSGPSVHYLLNDFIVVHDNFPDTRESEMRSFNWASIVGPAGDYWENGGWFDRTGNYNTNRLAWNHPINQAGIKNPPGWHKNKHQAAKKRPKYDLVKAKKPKWPDAAAKWIWMNQNKDTNQDTNFPPKRININGLHFYRTKAFNITSDGDRYQFAAHSDTYYEVWLDGELFMTGNGNENYKKFRKKTTVLGKSTAQRAHTIAVYVEDRKRKGKDYDHNDAFILTVQQLNTKGKPKKVILHSNKAQWFAWHGDKPPTWGRAMVFSTILREAQQRGVQSAQALSIRSNFGQVSEEGTPWDDNKTQDMQIQVGTSGLDLQSQFSESSRFDVSVDPDNLTLRAYQGGRNRGFPRGVDRTNNVALVPGYNLLNWTVTEADEIKNALLVQYNGGFVYTTADQESENFESIAKYGRREAYVELGGLASANAATLYGKSILTTTAAADKNGGSGDLVGHQNEEYNGSLIAVRGAVPFLDFDIGDTISAPASNGTLRPQRVLSITCTEDGDAGLTFDPELQELSSD